MNQQSSKLRIENVTKDSPWIQDIQALYEEAFPPRERFSFNYLIRVGARPGGHFEAIFDGDVLAGFCLWIEYSGVIYLPHAAKAMARVFSRCLKNAIQIRACF